MYFKKEDIREVSKHVFRRADSLRLVIGARDSAQFNKMIENILAEKSYFEGEAIDPNHLNTIKSNINTVINNISAYLVGSDNQFNESESMPNPVDYFSTAVDALYITAMQKLGCPNMPIIHFDKDIKKAIEESALKVSRSFVTLDISKEKAFNQQRGKDIAVISKEFEILADEIKDGKKAETVGRMVAEYQALKEHQENQNGFLRFLHRAENKDRNALIEKMGKFILEQLPEGMKDINLDEAVPNSVSRNIADALIRGEVDAAGTNRLDKKAIVKLYGCAPSDKHIPDREKISDEYSQKISLGKDEQFLNDVMGVGNVKINQVPKEKVFTNQNLVKD